jgi:hypothetical protein
MAGTLTPAMPVNAVSANKIFSRSSRLSLNCVNSFWLRGSNSCHALPREQDVVLALSGLDGGCEILIGETSVRVYGGACR